MDLHISTHWQIAYKTKDMEKFELIPNPDWAWVADPFLVEYDNNIYLFAELFLYKTERNGVIGYCKYENGKFGEWIVTMDKKWHLSYPNVFVHNAKLYMCPEMYQAEEVAIYELVSFPNEWKKVKIIEMNEKLVDSTFCKFNGENYMFTFKPTFQSYNGALYLYKLNDSFDIEDKWYITDDSLVARPGGNIFFHNDKMIRVSQESDGEYGTGVVFSRIEKIGKEYKEHIVRKIHPKDIIDDKANKYTGIHTYNRLGDIEVVDVSYTVRCEEEYIARKRVREVFCNKY